MLFEAGRARRRVIPISSTGGVLGLRVGWIHGNRLPGLKSVDNLQD